MFLSSFVFCFCHCFYFVFAQPSEPPVRGHTPRFVHTLTRSEHITSVTFSFSECFVDEPKNEP